MFSECVFDLGGQKKFGTASAFLGINNQNPRLPVRGNVQQCVRIRVGQTGYAKIAGKQEWNFVEPFERIIENHAPCIVSGRKLAGIRSRICRHSRQGKQAVICPTYPFLVHEKNKKLRGCLEFPRFRETGFHVFLYFLLRLRRVQIEIWTEPVVQHLGPVHVSLMSAATGQQDCNPNPHLKMQPIHCGHSSSILDFRGLSP